MKGDRLAVIDLGSNTFHLLICELNEAHVLIPLHKHRVYVKLASKGLGFIDLESEARGLQAMHDFAEKLDLFEVKTVKAVGTSALREASNGDDVVKRYSEATGIKISIIDGQKEADYILAGSKAALPLFEQPGLIMDIGGGSVEFILFKDDDITFKGSYKIGVSVVHKLFHASDPIAASEVTALEAHLDDQLNDLSLALNSISSFYLIGSSGSFEVIEALLPHLHTSANWSELDIRPLQDSLNKVIASDLSERQAIPEIPAERLDYIVVAFALIRYITLKFPPSKLFYCDFALKEGVLAELALEN